MNAITLLDFWPFGFLCNFGKKKTSIALHCIEVKILFWYQPIRPLERKIPNSLYRTFHPDVFEDSITENWSVYKIKKPYKVELYSLCILTRKLYYSIAFQWA